MTTGSNRLVPLLLPVVFVLLPVAGVQAQEDKWSIVFTPQVWFENIPKSGFAASNNAGGTAGAGNPLFPGTGFLAVVPSSALDSTGADPTSPLFPQWGAQLAAQYGRWTFGVAAQYLSFETRNSFSTTDRTFLCELGPGFTFVPCFFTAPFRGEKLYTETINTDRVDVDLTATYFFPDVIKDVLDVTAGLGFKWIRASGHRSLSDNNTGRLGANNTFGSTFPTHYILKKCGDIAAFTDTFNRTDSAPDDCLRTRASFLDQHYGVTIPTTLNVHLTRDGKWLLPVTMASFLGYEERTDEVIGFQKAFAYGGTVDGGVRYVFDNGIAVYAGYRAQVIQGNDQYLAHGPLFNMSVRFGGK